MKRMNDINDILVTEYGIFQAIQSQATFTWLSNDDAKLLDVDYYINHSGNKFITPLTDSLYNKDATTYLTTLAKIILLKYGDNWNKVYQAYFNTPYNPLENYSMVENEKYNTNITNTTDGEVNTFGFNTTSTDGVPNSKNGITQTSTGDKKDNYRELDRSGNIGVTTSQQMLQSELDLRRYDFYQMIMNDIDNVMCLDYRFV